jgi:hypothetical protein
MEGERRHDKSGDRRAIRGSAGAEFVRQLGESGAAPARAAQDRNKRQSAAARRDEAVHSQIVEHMTPFNEALRNGMVHRIWNMTTALGRAALDAEITRQAAIIAYVNDYKFMMLIALATMPIVFLLRKGAAQGTAGHAVLE